MLVVLLVISYLIQSRIFWKHPFEFSSHRLHRSIEPQSNSQHFWFGDFTFSFYFLFLFLLFGHNPIDSMSCCPIDRPALESITRWWTIIVIIVIIIIIVNRNHSNCQLSRYFHKYSFSFSLYVFGTMAFAVYAYLSFAFSSFALLFFIVFHAFIFERRSFFLAPAIDRLRLFLASSTSSSTARTRVYGPPLPVSVL